MVRLLQVVTLPSSSRSTSLKQARTRAIRAAVLVLIGALLGWRRLVAASYLGQHVCDRLTLGDGDAGIPPGQTIVGTTGQS